MYDATDAVRQVFPAWDVVGWYTVGALPPAAAAIQQQVHAHAENPVALVLHPSDAAYARARDTGTLPLTAYVPRGAQLVQAPAALGTAPAEHVVLSDANSRAQSTGDVPGDASAVLAALTAERDAAQTLYERLQQACDYVQRVQNGTLPHDHGTLRRLAAAVANQGSATPARFAALQSCVRPQTDAGRRACRSHRVPRGPHAQPAHAPRGTCAAHQLVELDSLRPRRGL